MIAALPMQLLLLPDTSTARTCTGTISPALPMLKLSEGIWMLSIPQLSVVFS